MPFKPGQPRPAGAGRRKGIPAKLKPATPPLPVPNRTLADRLKDWGSDPFETLAKIERGDLDCGVCRGSGKTKFQSGEGMGERRCQSCWGSGKERLSPKDRGWAAAELASYLEPKRKAIEVMGSGGGPVLTKIEVVMVPSKDGRRVE